MKTSPQTTKTLLAMIIMSAGLTALSLPAQAAITQGHAVPGAAQGHYGTEASNRLDSRLQDLKNRLSEGKRSGRISKKEGNRLSNSLNAIVSQKHSFERSGRGLSQPEINTLTAKIDTLSGQISASSRNGNRH